MMQATDRQLVHAFFLDRLGLQWSDDFRGVIYVPEEYEGQPAQMDHVAIAVAYNAFIGRTCCMHVVIQRRECMSARIVREAFEFPFRVCGCNAVLALVDSDNLAALTLDVKLGFKEIARVPNGGPEADLIVLQMLASECRWLSKPH